MQIKHVDVVACAGPLAYALPMPMMDHADSAVYRHFAIAKAQDSILRPAGNLYQIPSLGQR